MEIRHTLRKKGGLMKFLNIKEVAELTGASRASIYRWEKVGNFPQRRQISSSRVGWVESEIQNWMRARPPGLGQEERDVVMEDFAETVSTWDEEAVDGFNEAMFKKMEEE